MAERLIMRSYRRVFRVDRRIYRVDRWALPVPGGVPLRGGRVFRARCCAVLGGERLPVIGELVGALSPPLRYVIVPLGGRGARRAGGAGRARGASLRAGLAAAAAAGAAALARAARCRWRASRCAWHGAWRCAGTSTRRSCTAARVTGRRGSRSTAGARCDGRRGRLVARPAARRRAGDAVVLGAGQELEVRPMSGLPAALRAPEPAGRAGRRARGAVPGDGGLLSVHVGGGQARVAAAAGAAGVRGRGRLLAVAREPRLPGRALRRRRRRRCSTRAVRTRRRGGRTWPGTRRICASCARSCPRSIWRCRSRSAHALGAGCCAGWTGRAGALEELLGVGGAVPIAGG